MIITKTPLRLDIIGGSTDIANFYTLQDGKVFNATLNKYIYVMINKRFDGSLKVSTDKVQTAKEVSLLKHKYIKKVLEMFDIKNGLEITSMSDVHSQGSGLGSSSSFAVGLISALTAFTGRKINKRDLAEAACHLEIDIMKLPIGKQDQYAAAFGGLSHLTFKKNGYVTVKRLKDSQKIKNKLDKHLLVYYTGISRSSTNLLSNQHKNFEKTFPLLQKMVPLVEKATGELEKGRIEEFANLLNEEWEIKKKLVKEMTTNEIELMRKRALKAGAWGTKVSGAGGGGFVYMFAPISKHRAIQKALKGYKQMDFKFSEEGSKVIYSTC